MQSQLSILVLGGTGKTGSRVAQNLTERGHVCRIGSTRAALPFSWEDRTTWSALLEGINGVYIAHPDATRPGAAEQINDFSDFAVSSGVTRLVLLSSRENPRIKPIEDAVTGSGADWTILRASWFNQNFNEGFLLDAVLAGVIALPVGEGKEAFVDVNDIGVMAATVFEDRRHIGQRYDLSGPRLLSFSDVAAEIAAATGRNITYVSLDPNLFRASLREQGYPESMADGYAEIDEGQNAFVSGDFRLVTGREPTDFSEFARTAAATGIWDAE